MPGLLERCFEPQGLKPASFTDLIGTIKVVPFPVLTGNWVLATDN
jgi:hypothetical protein